MITIHSTWNFPPFLKGIVRDIRPVWLLEEVGLPYQVKWNDVQKGEHKQPAHVKHNPFGKVPAMSDGDFSLFESAAIVNYIADKAGKLIPKAGTRERALHDQWCFAAVNTVEQPVFDVFVCDTFAKDTPGVAERRAASLTNAKARMGVLDKELSGRDYIAGNSFSAADIMMTTVLAYARAPEILADAPHVCAYLERCTSRPAYQKALALQGKGPG